MVPSRTSTMSIQIAPLTSRIDAGCSRVVSPDDYSMSRPLSRCNSGGKSRSIPIAKRIYRTPSEIQLCEDTALADFRDYCMFSRIVNGISRRQSENQDIDLLYENDACLANIRRTRCQPPEESKSLQARHESLLHILGDPNRCHHPLSPHVHIPGDDDNMILEEDDIFVIDM